MKKLIKEFGDFIKRGNVIDLAVAVVIGGAFSTIVTSLVNDIIMPLIGMITGGIDFTSLTAKVGDATLAYGNFIQNIVNFLIIAFVIFMVIKAINKAEELGKEKLKRKKGEEAKEEVPAKPEDILLLEEIRDLLKKHK